MRHSSVPFLLLASTASYVPAQSAAPVKLTLQEAEALALKNHPQVQAAQHAASAMNQRIDEAGRRTIRSWPGMLPARRATRRSRIGAGYLTDLPALQSHRPRHHAQPVDHRLRPHPQPGRHLAPAGRRRRADRPGHKVRRAACTSIRPTSERCARRPW